ncbi:MAG: hypothetical protein E5Y31_25190 [Mesorhizobium sp.]|nr:MAG: hypothetical protein E5Y31_25190 [Mesorhizobium sp.]
MTAFLRNTLLAAIAVSALGGSALADQTITCSKTQTNDLWAGRCCGVGNSNCLGGEKGGRDHNDHGGRGNNGGTAGKK